MNLIVVRRKATNALASVLATGAALVTLGFLVWILFTLVSRGLAGLDVAFFTHLPSPPGEVGGGLANAVVGTLMLTAIAVAIGVPVGLLAGVAGDRRPGGRRGRVAAGSTGPGCSRGRGS